MLCEFVFSDKLHVWHAPSRLKRQWICHAKIKMSRKLRMKSGIAARRTFTLEYQSDVGEP